MKLLIVKTSSMGDVIHTFQAIEDIRRQRPDATIDWCVEESFADIVALHPAIRKIHTVAIRRWRKALFGGGTWSEMRHLRRALRDEAYDLVIDAQGLLKSAVVARQAGAPVAGFDRNSIREPAAAMFYAKRFAVSRDMHAIERTRRLIGRALGYEPDLSRLDVGLVAPPPSGIALPDASAFLLHGTSRADKKWRAEDWIGTARLLVARGLTPVTTWSNPDEQAVAEAIADAVPETRVIPKSPLGTIAAAIAHSKLVIGADTGLTHLAAAFGLPTVAVFLTTQPGLTGPRGAYASTILAMPGTPVTPLAVMTEADRLSANKTIDEAPSSGLFRG